MAVLAVLAVLGRAAGASGAPILFLNDRFLASRIPHSPPPKQFPSCSSAARFQNARTLVHPSNACFLLPTSEFARLIEFE